MEQNQGRNVMEDRVTATQNLQVLQCHLGSLGLAWILQSYWSCVIPRRLTEVLLPADGILSSRLRSGHQIPSSGPVRLLQFTGCSTCVGKDF